MGKERGPLSTKWSTSVVGVVLALTSVVPHPVSAEAALRGARSMVPTNPQSLVVDESVPAPTNLCAQSGNGFVRLSWDDTADAAVTGHTVQYRAQGTLAWSDGPAVTSATAVDVPGTNDTPYEYRVAATGAGSTRSNWGSYCLVTWGFGGASDPIGDGTTNVHRLPIPIRGGSLTGRAVIGIGENEAFGDHCVLTADGLVHCWGSAEQSPVVVSDGALATHRLKHLDKRCGIDTDDVVICWKGSLLLGEGWETYWPAVINTGALAGHTVKRVSSAVDHACAIRDDDRLVCWGANGGGQIGDGTQDAQTDPKLINGGDLSGQTVVDISVASGRTCAVTAAHATVCWGNNQNGEAGTATSGTFGVLSSVLLPHAVNGGALAEQPVREVALGNQRACAVTQSDSLVCWGRVSTTIDGQARTVMSLVPMTIDIGVLSSSGVDTVRPGGVSCGECFISSGGRPVAWTATGEQPLREQPDVVDTGALYLAKFSSFSVKNGIGAAVWGGVVAPGQPSNRLTVRPDNELVDDINAWINWDSDVLMNDQGLIPATAVVVEVSSNRGRTWRTATTCNNCVSRSVHGATAQLPVGRWWLRARTQSALGLSAPSAVVERYVTSWTQRTRALTDVTFVTDDGRPIIGATVTWRHVRLGFSQGVAPKTDSKGHVRLAKVPTGLLEFTLSGGRFREGRSTIESPGYWTVRTVVPSTGKVRAIIGSLPLLTRHTVTVELPDGTPVGGAVVTAATGVVVAPVDGSARYAGFAASAITDANGKATLIGYVERLYPQDLTVHFADGSATADVTASVADGAVITLADLPRVQLVGDAPGTVDPGAPLDITLRAVDAALNPRSGSAVSLTYSGKRDTRSLLCTGSLSGVTAVDGTVTFRICPKSSGVIKADGVDLVALPPVSVTMGPRSPSAVRDLVAVPGAGQVVLTWEQPRLNGLTAVRSYIVQASLNGRAWRKVRTLNVATRSTTVSGLTPGNYRFRVVAKNAKYLGAWTTTTTVVVT